MEDFEPGSDVAWITLQNSCWFSRGEGTERVGRSDTREEEDSAAVQATDDDGLQEREAVGRYSGEMGRFERDFRSRGDSTCQWRWGVRGKNC